MNAEKQLIQVEKILKKTYPEAVISLKYKNDMQLLVSVILSAQCTDKRVNIVTAELFKKYKSAEDFANADLKTFEQEIKSTGFYRNKAKNIIASAKIIEEKFNGKIPKTMHELLELPGVARKTANIVLSNAHGINEGIAVDTHVKRLSYRIGLSKNTNPEKIEKDLMLLTPRKNWNKITYLLIEHGRAVCRAPRPYCSKCPLNKICPKNGVPENKRL